MSLAAAGNLVERPHALALSDERVSLSWRDLDDLLNRHTNALLAIAELERIAIFANNSAELLVAHLAGLQAGLSTVPTNSHLTVEELTYILRDSRAGAIFAGPETVEVARAAASEAGVPWVYAWRSPRRPGVVPWETWVASASPDAPPTHMPPRPHLHYTSGTTGRPKAVETPPYIFPPEPTVADFFARRRAAVEGLGEVSPTLVAGPLYHSGPLTSLRMLGAGRQVVVLSRFEPEAALKAIDTFKVRSVMMVPTHFQRLLALPEAVRSKYDLSSLTDVLQSGAACAPSVKREMIAWLGPVLREVYGATEAGVLCQISSTEWLEKPGSVGRAVPQYEAVVLGDDGRPLGPDQEGRLYFRDRTGRGVIYHNDQDGTRSAHASPGVFTLGEIGYVDGDGYVFVTDRASDMIVSGGVNIYPAEIEKVLMEHPDIYDVAVVGAPNAEMGEEVKAIVALKETASAASDAELDAFCRQRLAGFKCPRSYAFAQSVGRNALGKINKRELRRQFWPSERTIGG
jgi:acyl-CoA synthetase (AMP-forming)/AMP-acid ligase II